mgnify:FL=1
MYKRSAWELFSSSEDPNVAAFMAGSGGDSAAFERSHEIQQQSLGTVVDTLKNAGVDTTLLYRSELSRQVMGGVDVAISVGGDGTFLETSHYVEGPTPILGVNSDPSRSVGFFTACDGSGFPSLFTNLGH